jgi:hypothetical protein
MQAKFRRALIAAFVYFLLVMIAGFVFGAAREFLFVPAFGRTIGEAIEAPFMLAAIAASAWAAIGWCRVAADLRDRLTMGLVSLALVLTAELGLSPFVRGSVQAWFDSFTPLTLGLAIVLWAVHAVMPIVLRPKPSRAAATSNRVG